MGRQQAGDYVQNLSSVPFLHSRLCSLPDGACALQSSKCASFSVSIQCVDKFMRTALHSAEWSHRGLLLLIGVDSVSDVLLLLLLLILLHTSKTHCRYSHWNIKISLVFCVRQVMWS